jgi:FkbM family methyltransferase
MGYSQNNEDEFVLKYFGDFKGTLLEVGANNGIDLSNSKLLIENGWHAHLVEPGTTCADLFLRHSLNPNVHIYNYGIGDRDEKVRFWESGNHVPHGKDKGLVSTADFEETKRWPHVAFTECEIELVKWDTFYNESRSMFHFISIDAEGNDWTILRQIDLRAVGCRVLCIEYNSDLELLWRFKKYCKGYHLAVRNTENLIFVNPRL